MFAACHVTEDYQRRRAKNDWKWFTSHMKRRQRLSRTLWFRNLRGLSGSCGTEQVSVLLWSVLKTKRYTVQWVRDPKNHVHGIQYYNFRHVFESELNTKFEVDSHQEPGVEGFLSGTSRRTHCTQTSASSVQFISLKPIPPLPSGNWTNNEIQSHRHPLKRFRRDSTLEISTRLKNLKVRDSLWTS